MNFLAIGNEFLEIKLNKSQSTLVSGRNGSGKSTFLDAITYALYGKAYRNINKPQLINSITKKNCLVELEFDIGKKKYLVRRGMNPGIFEIYCNNKLINQDAQSRDYQKEFEKTILRLPEKIFRQVIVLGNAGFTPFFNLPAANRRQIIEDLLDIQIFSIMNAILKDKIYYNKQEIKDAENEKKRLADKLDIIKKHEEDLRVQTEDLIKLQQNRIENCQDEIEKFEKDIEDFMQEVEEKKSTISDEKTFLKKMSELEEYARKYRTALNKFKKDIEFYNENNSCPSCHQNITDDFKKEVINTRKKKSKEILDKKVLLDQAVSQVNARLAEISEVQSNITMLNNKIFVANTEIKNLRNNVVEIQNYIKEIENQRNNSVASEDIKTVLSDIKVNNKLKEKLLKDQSIHDIAATLLKDTGIKTKIIKQYIPIINKLINKYLSDMDFFCEFELDESFSEKIRSRGRDDFSFHSFSEGEKARLTYALLLTWRDIAKLRNSISTNLLILDEVFDGSVDSEGSTGLVQIIQDMQDSNVFIISHKNELFDKFHSSIVIGKEKGFTKILTKETT